MTDASTPGVQDRRATIFGWIIFVGFFVLLWNILQLPRTALDARQGLRIFHDSLGLVVMVLAASGSVGHGFLIIWHLVGFSVLFGAGVSMFFSVPSLLHIFHSKPDTSIVFQFPMLLAPNFTVPLFMLAHAIALVKLFTI